MKSPARGFSFLEVLVSLALAATVTAIAVQSIQALSAAQARAGPALLPRWKRRPTCWSG